MEPLLTSACSLDVAIPDIPCSLSRSRTRTLVLQRNPFTTWVTAISCGSDRHRARRLAASDGSFTPIRGQVSPSLPTACAFRCETAGCEHGQFLAVVKFACMCTHTPRPRLSRMIVCRQLCTTELTTSTRAWAHTRPLLHSSLRAGSLMINRLSRVSV